MDSSLPFFSHFTTSCMRGWRCSWIEVHFISLWGKHGVSFRYGRRRRDLPCSSVKSTIACGDWGECGAVDGKGSDREWSVEFGFHSTRKHDGITIFAKWRERGCKYVAILESLLSTNTKIVLLLIGRLLRNLLLNLLIRRHLLELSGQNQSEARVIVTMKNY